MAENGVESSAVEVGSGQANRSVFIREICGEKARRSGLVGTDGEEFDELGEDAVAVTAGEGEGELREEQAIGRADIVAATGDGKRQITTARGEGVEGG